MKYPDSESSILEFKRELPKNDQIIKTIIGFCNQNGGKLVVGVTDNGEIKGLVTQELEYAMDTMEKAIFEATYPPIIPRVSSRRFKDKNVLEIEVSSGMNKPYYRKSEGKEKGTYIRLGRNTLRATFELIKELEWQSSGLSFETMPEVCELHFAAVGKYHFVCQRFGAEKIGGSGKLFDTVHGCVRTQSTA